MVGPRKKAMLAVRNIPESGRTADDVRPTVVCETCGARRGDALSKRELLELIREKRSKRPKCFAGGGGEAA